MKRIKKKDGNNPSGRRRSAMKESNYLGNTQINKSEIMVGPEQIMSTNSVKLIVWKQNFSGKCGETRK